MLKQAVGVGSLHLSVALLPPGNSHWSGHSPLPRSVSGITSTNLITNRGSENPASDKPTTIISLSLEFYGWLNNKIWPCSRSEKTFLLQFSRSPQPQGRVVSQLALSDFYHIWLPRATSSIYYILHSKYIYHPYEYSNFVLLRLYCTSCFKKGYFNSLDCVFEETDTL